MKVVWSNRALRSLADIHRHISTDSVEAANDTVDKILKRGDHLAAVPQLGKVVNGTSGLLFACWWKHPIVFCEVIVPEFGDDSIRELLVRSYRLVFRVSKKQVLILTLVHGAQRLRRF